jgi:curved DNA-binding protein CbpA
MKDYYKILGVEVEASEEEIRARWIELTKHYHPDLGKTEEGDEKIREINEAYEILKNESTRFHYDFERDLKRSFIKKAHRRQERRMNTRKIIIVPSGILVLCLIVGFILFRQGEVAPPLRTEAKTEAFKKIDKVSEKKTASQIPPVKTDSKAQEEKKAPKEIKEEVMPPESKKMVSLSPRLSPSAVEGESDQKKEPTRKILPESKEEPTPEVVMKSEIPALKEVSREVSREVPKEIAKEVPRELPKEAPKEVLKEAPKEVSREVPKEITKQIAKEVPKELPKEPPKEVIKATLHPAEKLTIGTKEEKTVPFRPPLLAKEEEVEQFFSNYVDRYDRKDVGGFLSFFSSKAVQNQKDGLEGIRSIYTKFFEESRALRYQIENMRTEIFQNRVEVKARFRVDQTLKKASQEKVWRGNIRWVLGMEDGTLKIVSLDYQNEKSP